MRKMFDLVIGWCVLVGVAMYFTGEHFVLVLLALAVATIILLAPTVAAWRGGQQVDWTNTRNLAGFGTAVAFAFFLGTGPTDSGLIGVAFVGLALMVLVFRESLAPKKEKK